MSLDRCDGSWQLRSGLCCGRTFSTLLFIKSFEHIFDWYYLWYWWLHSSHQKNNQPALVLFPSLLGITFQNYYEQERNWSNCTTYLYTYIKKESRHPRQNLLLDKVKNWKRSEKVSFQHFWRVPLLSMQYLYSFISCQIQSFIKYGFFFLLFFASIYISVLYFQTIIFEKINILFSVPNC